MKEIEETYTRVTDWLKYAEAKNAILVAFDSTVSLAIAGLLSENKPLGFIPEWYIQLSLIFFVGGAAIALVSFLPQLAQFKTQECSINSTFNPLFFCDIAKLSEDQYITLLGDKYELHDKITPYDKDLINQIINNSKITTIKFQTFTIALWLNISVFLTPFIFIVPLFLFLKGRYDRKRPSTKQI